MNNPCNVKRNFRNQQGKEQRCKKNVKSKEIIKCLMDDSMLKMVGTCKT